MIPSGRCVLGWGLAAVILLAGCATFPPPREAGRAVPREQREALFARLQIREGQIRSVRGIAAIEVTLNEETRRFREALALRSDGRFRLETLGAFGLPVLIIASDGNRVVVHRVSEQAGVVTDGERLLNGLLGLKLPPAAFVRLLTGLPPRPVVPSSFVSYLPGRQAYLFEGEDGNSVQRLYLDSSGALLGGEIWTGRQGLRFTFSAVRDVGGIAYPMGITLAQVRRPVSVRVAYQKIDINPVLADRLFTLPQSTAVKNGGN
jgi:outer membrane lipoprotein-sorting protein